MFNSNKLDRERQRKSMDSSDLDQDRNWALRKIKETAKKKRPTIDYQQ